MGAFRIVQETLNKGSRVEANEIAFSIVSFVWEKRIFYLLRGTYNSPTDSIA